MHHRPAGPPLSARLHGALTRWWLLSQRALRRRGGRVALAVLVSAVVTAVLLGLPVGSSDGRPPVALDASASSSSTSESGSPVVMGRDGKPVPATSSAPDVEPSAPSSSEATVDGPASSAGSVTDRATPPGATSSTPRSTTPGTTTPRTTYPGTTTPPVASAQPPTPPSADVPTPEAPALDEQVLALVNAARAEEGCGALVSDASLTGLAEAHSADMRDAGALDLLVPGGGSLLDLGGRAATVARGSDPTEVVAAWLSDGDTRTAILDCSLETVGIGVVGGTWWTQLLS